MKKKRNKADLLERLKKYPKLRLRNNKHLYIIDTAKYEGCNIAGVGSIEKLHESLDYHEKYNYRYLKIHGL